MTSSGHPAENEKYRPPGSSLVAKTFEDGGKHYTALSASFLLVCLYVLVTVSSTTHRHLLLGGSLSLPLLNASIPLKGFFVVAPALVLVLHVNLLLQNHVLLRRLRDERLKELGGDEDFLLFPSLPVLGGLWLDRREIHFLLGAAVLTINAVMPLGILCFTQYKFLPYHSFGITLVHQLLVVLDVVVIWCFLVKLLPSRGVNVRGTIMVLVFVLIYSFIFAVVPGTWIELWWVPCPASKCLTRNLELPGEWLISEPPPPELLAAYETKGEDRMLAFVKHSVGARLANRDLRDANLERAKLFNADLRGADLRGALLGGADLRQANLTPPGQSFLMEKPPGIKKSSEIMALDRSQVRMTNLDKTYLREADFTGAKLILVRLVQADLQEAKLSGVELTRANLKGANLEGAKLDGAELSFARLDGARMANADLSGATFFRAWVEGATLRGAKARGANFAEANLKGVQFADALLGRADFRDADLVGSDFRGASLHEATSLRLDLVDLRGAHVGGVSDFELVRLVDLRLIDAGGTVLPVPGQGQYLLYSEESRPENWPSLAKQGGDTWDEAEFHRVLAANLLELACKSEGLATTLVRRAAGTYNPGDLDFDLELARQLFGKLENPGCTELLTMPPPIKRRIAWRLRMKAQVEFPPGGVSRPTPLPASTPLAPPASLAPP